MKTLESKETRASKEITVTHNSVFAAHRLQCRMTTRKNRHPAFLFSIYTAIVSQLIHTRRGDAHLNFRSGFLAFYAHFTRG